MDVQGLIQTLWRRRWLTLGGVVVAVVAGYLVTFKPGGLTYRQAPVWSSSSTVFVTQAGFPWGRTTLPSATVTDGTGAGSTAAQKAATDSNAPNFADPSRFFSLAIVYASIIQSDQILGLIPHQYVNNGKITAQSETVGSGGNVSPLPLIAVSATGPTPAAAHALDVQTIKAFQRYLANQQGSNSIPAKQRVTVTTLNTPSAGSQLSGPGRLPGIAVFLIVLIATVVLARKLEEGKSARTRDAGTAPGGQPVAPAQPAPFGHPVTPPQPVAPATSMASGQTGSPVRPVPPPQPVASAESEVDPPRPYTFVRRVHQAAFTPDAD